jgi:plasmid stabilization system protein ParE
VTPNSYEVRFTRQAEDDLVRLTDFLLQRAEDLHDLNQIEGDIAHLRQIIQVQLASSPWSIRKAGTGDRTTRRELVVPAGATGYVALLEIETGNCVQVLAVRHQLEQDYH